ncbi:hypothetical protein NDN08_006684 [Rhodosorus marinus]|uniref:Bromo domain-containing protein n=1 Tax=Rhodosorus marinus TaxID=101924 RepID=A0AAV8UM30_9RHOD|nr:hypothetical protein NDN08_006684 [Rhodosorus marinus]
MKNGKGKGKGGSRPGSDVVYPDFLSAIKGKGNEIVDKLSRADVYNIFAEPVDPNEVVGYLTIIKSPMDLGTVRQKLESGKYSSLDNLEADIDLIWSNCCTFNPPATVFFKNAVKLRTQSEKYFRAVRDYFTKNQIPTSTGEGESSDSDKGQREGKSKQAKSTASNDVKRGRKPGFVKKEVPGLEAPAVAKERVREKRVPTATLIESHHLTQIPRAKFDVQDPLWKELGARPRGNPCRPMASITSIRMKDYATSLMFFANPGGTLARRAVTDLVGADRKPQQVAASKKLERPNAVTPACPKEVDELIRRSNLIMTASMTANGDSLNEKTTFLRYLGTGLGPVVERIELSELDFTAPYGVDARSLSNTLESLSSEGFDTKILKELLDFYRAMPTAKEKHAATLGSVPTGAQHAVAQAAEQSRRRNQSDQVAKRSPQFQNAAQGNVRWPADKGKQGMTGMAGGTRTFSSTPSNSRPGIADRASANQTAALQKIDTKMPATGGLRQIPAQQMNAQQSGRVQALGPRQQLSGRAKQSMQPVGAALQDPTRQQPGFQISPDQVQRIQKMTNLQPQKLVKQPMNTQMQRPQQPLQSMPLPSATQSGKASMGSSRTQTQNPSPMQMKPHFANNQMIAPNRTAEGIAPDSMAFQRPYGNADAQQLQFASQQNLGSVPGTVGATSDSLMFQLPGEQGTGQGGQGIVPAGRQQQTLPMNASKLQGNRAQPGGNYFPGQKRKARGRIQQNVKGTYPLNQPRKQGATVDKSRQSTGAKELLLPSPQGGRTEQTMSANALSAEAQQLLANFQTTSGKKERKQGGSLHQTGSRQGVQNPAAKNFFLPNEGMMQNPKGNLGQGRLGGGLADPLDELLNQVREAPAGDGAFAHNAPSDVRTALMPSETQGFNTNMPLPYQQQSSTSLPANPNYQGMQLNVDDLLRSGDPLDNSYQTSAAHLDAIAKAKQDLDELNKLDYF